MQEKQSLHEMLEQEISLLKELNSLSLLKKDALLKDDLDAMQIIVLKEEALSQKLKKIDDACSPQVQFFLKGQSSISSAANNQAGKISATLDELRKVALQLKLNNEFNQALIKDALAITEFTINALLPQTNGDNGIYEASGKVTKDKKNAKKTLILDYKG